MGKSKMYLLSFILSTVFLFGLTLSPYGAVSVSAQNEPTGWTRIGLSGVSIDSIAVDPSNLQIIYTASTTVGIGAFKTIDGGESWYPIKAGFPGKVAITSLAVDPQNPQALHAK